MQIVKIIKNNRLFLIVLSICLSVICALGVLLCTASNAWATTVYDATTKMTVTSYTPEKQVVEHTTSILTKTGDWLLPVVLILISVIVLALVVVLIIKKKSISKNAMLGSVIALVLCTSIGVFGFATVFTSDQDSAQAHADEAKQEVEHTSGKFITEKMEIKCNTDGGEIVYGNDPYSNKQTFTNITNKTIALNGISIAGDKKNWKMEGHQQKNWEDAF